MPLKDTLQFEVVVVLAERVNERLGNLEPTHIEEELQQREDGDEEVNGSVGVLLSWVQELTAQHREEEEGIHRHRGHLGKEKGVGGGGSSGDGVLHAHELRLLQMPTLTTNRTMVMKKK